MIRSLYLTLYGFLLVCLVVVLVLFFTLFHKDTLPYLAQKYHKYLCIEYDTIEGNIFYGMRVEGLVYKDFLQIQELHIEYNLLMLFAPTPRVAKISTNGLVFDHKRFEDLLATEDHSGDSFALFVKELSMQNTQLITSDESFVADLNASDILYDNDLTIKNYLLKLDSSYGEFRGEGKLQNKEIHADLAYTPSDTIAKEYLADLHLNTPSIPLTLDLNEKRVLLHSLVEKLSIKGIEDLLIQDLDLKVNYELQSAATQLDVNISYKDFALQVQTKNYKDFDYQLWSPYLFAQGDLTKNKQGVFVTSTIDLNTSLALYDKLPLDTSQIQQIQLQAQYTKEKAILKATTALAKLDLEYAQGDISGVLALKEQLFYLSYQAKMQELVVDAQIDSLEKFLDTLKLDLGNTTQMLDAKVGIKTKLFWDDSLCLESAIKLPYYTIKLQDQSPLHGEDLSFNLSYCKEKLLVKSYTLELDGQHFYATKPSRVLLLENGDLYIEDLSINDTMRVEGRITDKRADLAFVSEKFLYHTEDLHLLLEVDLNASIEFGSAQKISGMLTLLDGNISKMPKENYTIKDKDIIIIQDIQKKQKSQREIDIKIKAKKAIHYKVEHIDLEFVPDLQLKQSRGEDLQIYGKALIQNGKLTLRDRVFVFEPSALEFDTKELDPKLDLHLHHTTLDNKVIKIYVTHKMSDPVILFSSEPVMSQEDILSYILFGSSASSVFDTSDDGGSKSSVSALLLGAGFKQMLNQSEFFDVDTLNILTNKEGTLGYEIGARINKHIRLVYKNDTVTSMILQYTLNQNIRIDVDVDDTGQGVSIIYVKEFGL